MKRLFCRSIAFFAVLLFVYAPARAADPMAIHLESYQAEGGNMQVYFNTNIVEFVSAGQLSLMLGGQPMAVRSLNRFSETGQTATYMFLVDISGSISAKEMAQMKSIMTTITKTMGEDDNGSVCTVGNSVAIMPFVTGKDAISQQIDAITGTQQDTNLYAAIVKALDTLNTDSTVKAKKCLIILSDGEDFYNTGYTRAEVEEKIKASHLPVYTVSMLSQNTEQKIIEASKVLGSFSRLSAGGVDATFGVDKTTVDDIANQINKSIQNSYVLTADISTASVLADQSYLEIELNVKGEGLATDGYMVNGAKIRVQVPTPTPAHTSAPPTSQPSPSATEAIQTSAASTSPKPAQTEPPKVTKPTPFWYLLIASVVIVAVIVLLLVVLGKRHRGRGAPQTVPETGAETGSLPVLSGVQERVSSPTDLCFTKVGLTEGKTFAFKLKNEMIIGRDPVKSQLAFSDDGLLSAQHCKIRKAEGQVYLSDLNSTNGTFLNGVPVRQECVLEQDDVILIGSMELRISWKQ